MCLGTAYDQTTDQSDMMPQPRPPRRGQRPHVPTAQTMRTVESMTAYGIPQAAICSVLGIKIDTLYKYYRSEIDTGVPKMIAAVAQSLYKQAVGSFDADGKVILAPSVGACCFILKTRAGWKESISVDNTSSDGSMSPIGAITRTIIDPSNAEDT